MYNNTKMKMNSFLVLSMKMNPFLALYYTVWVVFFFEFNVVEWEMMICEL